LAAAATRSPRRVGEVVLIDGSETLAGDEYDDSRVEHG
jgi:hypothetical protein